MVVGHTQAVFFEDHARADVEVSGAVAIEQVEFIESGVDIGAFGQHGNDCRHGLVGCILEGDRQALGLVFRKELEFLVIAQSRRGYNDQRGDEFGERGDCHFQVALGREW